MSGFHVDRSGRWSGGGGAVLANLDLAERTSRTIGATATAGSIAIVPRNAPTRASVVLGPFVWMPQNALPWAPPAPAERTLQLRLRAASEVMRARARAMVRISGAIPPLRTGRPTSRVLHNVLDEGFEAALPPAAPGHGAFVCAGSAHGYRNLVPLVRGFARYRSTGGRTDLLLQTTPGSPSVEAALAEAASAVPGLRVRAGADRRATLSLMAGSAGVVLPSSVEASPMTLLEAQALARPVACSTIRAHDELLGDCGSPRFDAAEESSVAAALHALDERGGVAPHPLGDPARRERERARWVASLVEFLDEL